MKKDKTPLPIMDELFRKLRDCDFITQVDIKAGVHLLRMALGQEKFTAFWTKLRLYKYTVMPFELTNAQANFQREINQIL